MDHPIDQDLGLSNARPILIGHEQLLRPIT